MSDKLIVERLQDLRICDIGLRRVAAKRIKQLTAERDRYRKALEDIIADCEADYPPSHGAIKYAAKLALKGNTHD